MSIVSDIVGQGVATTIDAVGNLYTTDKARLEAEKNLANVLQQPQLEQLKTNQVLAAATSIFTNGWQPMLGWTCGFLIFLYYAPQIIIATYIWSNHCLVRDIITPFPIKADDILNVVYLLFGFGAHSIIKGKVK